MVGGVALIFLDTSAKINDGRVLLFFLTFRILCPFIMKYNKGIFSTTFWILNEQYD